MSCEWRQKVALLADDEMPEAEAQEEVSAHLRSCPECSSAMAEQLELKRAVRVAGSKFTAPPELHAAIYRQLHPEHSFSRWWKWATVALAALLFATAVFFLIPRNRANDTMIARLVDQHVTMLASANPVDVVNSDRHTVKPWFQGKLPFSFNLPELAGTPFTLVGGKAVYADQRPGAQLVYQAGQHRISVFVFQEQDEGTRTALKPSFSVKNWVENGLHYYLITDANEEESGRLIKLFQEANRS